MSSLDDTFLKSMFYEQLVEYVFVSEVLQESWYYFGKTVEILRPEVDAFGYDVVFECEGIVRHVQLKTSNVDASARGQKVNIALADKPSGCVVWVRRHEDFESCRMRLSYLFFGDEHGKPLPSLEGFRIAKTNKHNAERVKKERKAIRVVPKGRFTKVASTRELVGRLFGLKERVSPNIIEAMEALPEETEEQMADG